MFVVTATGTAYVSIASEYGPEEEDEEEACVYFFRIARGKGKKERTEGIQIVSVCIKTDGERERKKTSRKERRENSNSS